MVSGKGRGKTFFQAHTPTPAITRTRVRLVV